MIKAGSIEHEQANLFKAEGNKAFSVRNYEEAIESFTKAINCNPYDHTFYTNRAVCYYNLKKYAESLEDANRSLNIQPSWIKGYWRKGLAEFCLGLYYESEYSFKTALALDSPNESFKILVKYLKALRSLPQEVDIMNQMILTISQSDSKQYNFPKNPNLPQKLLNLLQSPENLPGLIESDLSVKEFLDFCLANESLNSENLVEEHKVGGHSQNDLREEHKQDDAASPSMIYSSEIAKKAGNEAFKKKLFQLALKYYERALELDPKEYMVYNNKAAVFLTLKKYQRALEEVERALEVYYEEAPDFQKLAKIYHRKANIYAAMQDYDRAIDFYKKSWMEHMDPQVKADLANAELLKKKAEAEKRRAEEKKYINPDIADQQKEKADELMQKGDFVAALKEYEEALKRNPHYATLYYRKAVCLGKLLEIPEALKAVGKAIELDPLCVDAWILKGGFLELMREYNKAEDAYLEGLRIEPNNIKCQQKIEEIRIKQQK